MFSARVIGRGSFSYNSYLDNRRADTCVRREGDTPDGAELLAWTRAARLQELLLRVGEMSKVELVGFDEQNAPL